jgi:hypothetical protein
MADLRSGRMGGGGLVLGAPPIISKEAGITKARMGKARPREMEQLDMPIRFRPIDGILLLLLCALIIWMAILSAEVDQVEKQIHQIQLEERQ